jgi:hypothetical protein
MLWHLFSCFLLPREIVSLIFNKLNSQTPHPIKIVRYLSQVTISFNNCLQTLLVVIPKCHISFLFCHISCSFSRWFDVNNWAIMEWSYHHCQSTNLQGPNRHINQQESIQKQGLEEWTFQVSMTIISIEKQTVDIYALSRHTLSIKQVTFGREQHQRLLSLWANINDSGTD